jgi:DNA-binding NarL/FixJ family response regulator
MKDNAMKEAPLLLAMADDHTLMRKGLKQILEAKGRFKVTMEGRDGSELLRQLKEAQAPPTICLLDISMKPMNGYDTAKEMTQKWPNVKVIALSMHYNPNSISRMLCSGACAFLAKDSEPEELEKAIIQVHENGCYHPAPIAKIVKKIIENNKIGVPQLTKREQQFLILSCNSECYDKIGKLMNVGKRTVEGYAASIGNKFGIHTRQEFTALAFTMGLVPA